MSLTRFQFSKIAVYYVVVRDHFLSHPLLFIFTAFTKEGHRGTTYVYRSMHAVRPRNTNSLCSNPALEPRLVLLHTYRSMNQQRIVEVR